MATLTAADFMSGRGLKHETVPVPSLGGEAQVYELAPRQRIEFVRWISDLVSGTKDFTLETLGALEGSDTNKIDVGEISEYADRLLAMTLRDDDGKLIFPDPHIQVTHLSDFMSDDEIKLLQGVAERLSLLGDAAVEEKARELPNSPDASAS